jgi:hypothetical protein
MNQTGDTGAPRIVAPAMNARTTGQPHATHTANAARAKIQ